MAVLNANPIYKVYQSDGVNNTSEAPGSGVIPADGSTSNTATPGKTPGIVAQNAPGVAAAVLSEKTIQNATSTVAAVSGALATVGLQVDSTAIVPNTGSNFLANDTSAMALGNASVPTQVAAAKASAGKSQSPQTQG